MNDDNDDDDDDLVWYCSYGSNMLDERFRVYLEGGRIEGNVHHHEGCRDRQPPRDVRLWRFRREMFFGAYSSWWKGLVCGVSLEEHPDHEAIGRIYLVTRAQFYDVLVQENSLPIGSRLPIDWTALREHRRQSLLPEASYGELLLLGEVDGHPVLSFSHGAELQDRLAEAAAAERRTASAAYLRVIGRGLQADLSVEEVVAYLGSRRGVAGRWSEDELREMLL